jgi:predicted SnoaL-like aldol condensation-catalyzing enzyme
MKLSRDAEREFVSAAEALKHDAEVLRRKRHNPFIKDGRVDIDAYIEFVTQFNEFINHSPKPFRKIVDRDMRL